MKSRVAYTTINGFETQINFTKIPKDTTEIIIASDGFKILKPTLEETLKVLKSQLKSDPHCINELQSTKGLLKGNISFDDMCYLRLKI